MKILAHICIAFILGNLRPMTCTKKESAIHQFITLNDTTVMKYTADELIQQNGKPWRDSLFLIKEADRSRDFLWDYIPPRDSSIIIRELRWELDTVKMLDIWYIKNIDTWSPVTYDFYLKGSEF